MVTTLPGDQSGGGTDAWLRETIIILCPSSFVDDDYTDEPQLQAQPIGTHLDDMGITAITLLHELFHAVQPGIGDHNPYLPKYTVDAHGNNIYHRELVT